VGGAYNRSNGPRQVVHYNAGNDPTGMHRLAGATGFWRYVAYLGFIVMTLGLAAFGFVLLSTFMAASEGSGVPKMPRELPIAFGVALAGGVAYQLGIGLAPQKRQDVAQYWDYSVDHRSYDQRQYDDHSVRQDFSINSDGGQQTVGTYAPQVHVTIGEQLARVDALEDEVRRLGVDRAQLAEAVAAINDLRMAIGSNAGERAIDNRLRRVANTLGAVGALAGGATAVFTSLVALAGALGPAGAAVAAWLNEWRT
jgi:hypothetical protein